ncbi:hypothetical protein L6452_05676 [Arctium lappa]|uniref:Uncharacterized protein n=1 Tax=Arctium lappa TaxID=4217 RepID=A0ACB9EI48_ARCLA|nr:hypothetical protein L6452_05676 [Arctium lappa]
MSSSASMDSGSRTSRRTVEFGRTCVVRPKAKHQAIIVWLHNLGDNEIEEEKVSKKSARKKGSVERSNNKKKALEEKKGKESKKEPTTPAPPTIERPGRGTALKDIPNAPKSELITRAIVTNGDDSLSNDSLKRRKDGKNEIEAGCNCPKGQNRRKSR